MTRKKVKSTGLENGKPGTAKSVSSTKETEPVGDANMVNVENVAGKTRDAREVSSATNAYIPYLDHDTKEYLDHQGDAGHQVIGQPQGITSNYSTAYDHLGIFLRKGSKGSVRALLRRPGNLL